jgi:hypothetical protein
MTQARPILFHRRGAENAEVTQRKPSGVFSAFPPRSLCLCGEYLASEARA